MLFNHTERPLGNPRGAHLTTLCRVTLSERFRFPLIRLIHQCSAYPCEPLSHRTTPGRLTPSDRCWACLQDHRVIHSFLVPRDRDTRDADTKADIIPVPGKMRELQGRKAPLEVEQSLDPVQDITDRRLCRLDRAGQSGLDGFKSGFLHRQYPFWFVRCPSSFRIYYIRFWGGCQGFFQLFSKFFLPFGEPLPLT